MTNVSIETIKGPGGARLYRHPVTGETAPSVTSILNVISKPALTRWASKEAAIFAVENRDAWLQLDDPAAVDLIKGSPWRKSTKAATAGTDAHTYAEELLLGQRPMEEEFAPPGVHPRSAESIKSIIRHLNAEVVTTEVTTWNRSENYAGTFDALLRIDGELALADWKTNRTAIYPETALQCCAYARAELIVLPDGTEYPMPEVKRALALHIPAESDAGIHDLNIGDTTWEAFKGARTLFEWQTHYATESVGPRQQPKAPDLATA